MSKLLQSYLRFWAVKYLSRTHPKIVAVTGSVGKTSTKEAIFEVLKIKFGEKVRKSEGNLNTETGVPLAVLGFQNTPTNIWGWLPVLVTMPFRSASEPAFEWLVLELAADKPGDINYLTSFVKPQIAVLTAIGPAHLAAFGSIENIIEEKTNLLRALPGDGWAVLNVDETQVRKVSYGGRWRKATFGIENEADFKASNIQTQIKNFVPETKCDIQIGKNEITVVTHTLGQKANVSAQLAAAAIGHILEIGPSEIKKGLEKIQPEAHRMNVLRGKNNTVIIDDCYNANPVSMNAALDVLKNLSAKRKIAVLGGMREIGKITNESHRLMGQYAKEVAIKVVTVGELAKKYEIKDHFNQTNKAIKYLLNEIQEGDIILIKASRAVGLEKIVEALKV